MKNPCCAPWRPRNLLKLLLLLLILMVIGGVISYFMQYRDREPDRGAIPMPEQDKFGESFSTVKYLEQGWEAKDSLWFYSTTQGSDLLPYDFFIALEQKDSSKLFRDNANMNNYRYLPQKPTLSNPDGLPVGFVEDTYKGKSYVGLTCAACHTGQVNHKGTAMRIDGGPAGADMENFIADMGKALSVTQSDAAKLDRFTKAVLQRGNFKTADEVRKDLAAYTMRINAYRVINHPKTPYRYGRLDAFGRIYNRVLEHVMSAEQLEEVLREMLTPEELATVMKGVKNVLTADDRDHILTRIQAYLTPRQQLQLRDKIFNGADAPVSYPFIWDIPQHDYVQWNGLLPNDGITPLGRNAGEVIGVFGTLDWQKKKGWTLSSALGGQGWFTDSHIDYSSSVDVRNLRRLEHKLVSLYSPLWPSGVLGVLNSERVARGEKLFSKHCESCHAEIVRDSPERRVIASMTKVESIGTDPTMADDSVNYSGYSGILRNLYVSTPTGVGDILIQQKAPVAALLTKVDQNVLATPDPDKWLIRSWLERLFDFVIALRDNEIKASIRQGDYTPATTAAPFASLRAYKGRSLNGIWATAPYMHNGSMPTLYDVVLPKKGECVTQDGEYRPDSFKVGSREYDPVKAGFITSVGDDFDTTLKNNGNAGHTYGNCQFSKEDRLDLVEYMKSL